MYGLLFLYSLIPAITSLILFIVKSRINYFKKHDNIFQIICGIIFGGLAILGTERGVDIGGAVANVRDAAPLCAGLIFGPHAGVIAGIIGGVERWFAVAWGVGEYSRIACSVATIFAGFFAAFLHNFFFDRKIPHWLMGFISGSVMEIFHMTLVFVTHLDEPLQAYEIVRICTIPMTLSNGFSVLLSISLIAICESGIRRFLKQEKKATRISQQVQVRLLIAVAVAFAVSSWFIFEIQHNTALNNADTLLEQCIEDLSYNIRDEADAYALELARLCESDIESNSQNNLKSIALRHGVSDIFILDSNGIITDTSSNVNGILGFDLHMDKLSNPEQIGSIIGLLGDSNGTYASPYQAFGTESDIMLKLGVVNQENGGLVIVGIDENTMQEKLSEQVRILSSNRHVGETGYLVVTNDENTIISSDPDLDTKTLTDLISGIDADLTPMNRISVCIGDTDYFCMAGYVESYIVYSLITQKEIFSSRDTLAYINTYMEILVFASMFITVYLIIRRVVVSRLQNVNTDLESIISGNLDTVIKEKSSEEFELLSHDINSTVDTLKQYISDAEERIKAELALAKSIQKSVLPSVFPPYPDRTEFALNASMDAAKEVGGDFYDFFFVSDDRLVILIADVSGKGIPAAMFMMNARSIIHNLAESGISAADILAKANDRLCAQNDTGMFVTAWMGIINIRNGHMDFVNAGHNPPVIYKKDSGFEYLKSKHGFVLAGMEGVRYQDISLDFKPGDRLLLYTDGVTEAVNESFELYGEDRLISFLNNHTDLNNTELISGIRKDMNTFSGKADQADDITMLLFDYFGLNENDMG